MRLRVTNRRDPLGPAGFDPIKPLLPAGWQVRAFVACISSRIETVLGIIAAFVAVLALGLLWLSTELCCVDNRGICINFSSTIATVIHITMYLTNRTQSEPFAASLCGGLCGGLQTLWHAMPRAERIRTCCVAPGKCLPTPILLVSA